MLCLPKEQKNKVQTMSFNPRKKRRKPDWVSEATANAHEITPREVNNVRNGERKNEAVLETVMELIEGHNKLIEEVTARVRFDKSAQKNTKSYGDLI